MSDYVDYSSIIASLSVLRGLVSDGSMEGAATALAVVQSSFEALHNNNNMAQVQISMLYSKFNEMQAAALAAQQRIVTLNSHIMRLEDTVSELRAREEERNTELDSLRSQVLDHEAKSTRDSFTMDRLGEENLYLRDRAEAFDDLAGRTRLVLKLVFRNEDALVDPSTGRLLDSVNIVYEQNLNIFTARLMSASGYDASDIEEVAKFEVTSCSSVKDTVAEVIETISKQSPVTDIHITDMDSGDDMSHHDSSTLPMILVHHVKLSVQVAIDWEL